MSTITTTVSTLAPACFGVACPLHGRCQRYFAIAATEADPHTIVTCRVGDRFPLFLASAPARAPAMAIDRALAA